MLVQTQILTQAFHLTYIALCRCLFYFQANVLIHNKVDLTTTL